MLFLTSLVLGQCSADKTGAAARLSFYFYFSPPLSFLPRTLSRPRLCPFLEPAACPASPFWVGAVRALRRRSHVGENLWTTTNVLPYATQAPLIVVFVIPLRSRCVMPCSECEFQRVTNERRKLELSWFPVDLETKLETSCCFFPRA